jgi:hypothetical protein
MKKTSIGLSELINQVKCELLEEPDSSDSTPFLSVDEIELEISVTATKKAEGGINIQVVEFGSSVGHTSVHTVRVKLLPLLTHEERLEEIRKDARWKKIKQINIEGALKKAGNKALAPDRYKV